MNINGKAAAIETVCRGFSPPAISMPTAITDCTIPQKNIRLFDGLLPGYAWLTPVKKVDFLLWSER